jgi:hypothetical protein
MTNIPDGDFSERRPICPTYTNLPGFPLHLDFFSSASLATGGTHFSEIHASTSDRRNRTQRADKRTNGILSWEMRW